MSRTSLPGLQIARIAALLACLVLAACGRDRAPDAAPPAFTLNLDSPTLTVGQGREARLGITLTRDSGFDGDVQVSLNQPPAGVSADTLTLSNGIHGGRLPIRIAPDVQADSVLVLDVKASSGNLSRNTSSSVTVSLPQPYAQAKIAAALAARTIDYGTSLLYRAYALFGDSRLPDTHLGAGSVAEDNLLFEEIRLHLGEFPAERQAELRAFIVRPTDPLSVWNRAAAPTAPTPHLLASAPQSGLPPTSCASQADGTWISKLSSKYSLRVWMQCGPAPLGDAAIQRFIDVTLTILETAYEPMTAVMSGPPLSDFEGGGDNAIDFYFVNDDGYVSRSNKRFTPEGDGATYTAPPYPGNRASAFVLLPRSTLLLAKVRTSILHEFFHVLQNARNGFLYWPEGCKETKCTSHWFVEASAAWAGAYFEKSLWSSARAAFDGAYHRFPSIFQPSDAALNAEPDGSQHEYSAFIWPYFVEQETKSAEFMKQIWVGLERAKTAEAADDAIDAAYPFALNFRRFAIRNLNKEYMPGGPLPESERYVARDPEQFRQADNKEPTILAGDLVAERAYSQPLELANLSARYVRLEVKGSNIKKVELDTGSLAPDASLVAQALVDTSNGWVAKPIELPNGKAIFCFDRGPTTQEVLGSFKTIVLVLSNHALRKNARITGTLNAMPTATPCSPYWEGKVHQTYSRNNSAGTLRIDMTARAAFEFDPANPTEGALSYRLHSGTYSYEARFDNINNYPKPCGSITTAGGKIPVQPYTPPNMVLNQTQAGITLSVDPASAPPTPIYSGGGFSIIQFSETGNCYSESDVTTVRVGYHFWWLESRGIVSADGKVIEGSHDMPDHLGGTLHWDYKFEKKP